jgi:L-asparaginase
MPSLDRQIVILGTGGTIAGMAASAADNVGYTAGALAVQQLVSAAPPLAAVPLATEQVASLDSKDMDAATWQRLAGRAAFHLARPEVAGIVVTHGTDTLEETAWLLHRVLAPAKPLVLTAAMRPASSLAADGPQNLVDAVTVACEPAARGVLAVLAGQVHAAADLRKAHSYRVDAFDSGDAGPVGQVVEGRLRRLRDWPQGEALGVDRLGRPPQAWPWVEVLPSHAAARGDGIDAWAGAGIAGIVVAGTGSGTLHRLLQAALERAAARGVEVRLASRCPAGPVLAASPWRSYPGLSPFKARVELMLELLARQ